MDEQFSILLQAMLDKTKSKQNIDNDITFLKEKVKNLEIRATLAPDTIKKLSNQLGSIINQKVVINDLVFNDGNINSQANRVGTQIGDIISKASEKSISNVSAKGFGHLKLDKSISENFEREIKKLVGQWTNNKGKLTNVKIDTKTTFDNKTASNITELNKVLVTYKNQLDEVIQKTIAWRQIDNDGNYGFVEVAGKYSKSLDDINEKSDTFIEKQKKVAAQLRNANEELYGKAIDQNSSNPIRNSSNLDVLKQQYDKVNSSIDNLGNSTKSTFVDMQIEVERNISNLKVMVSEFKNAEAVATSLRTKSFDTVKSVEIENLAAFESKIKSSQVPVEQLQNELASLGNTLEHAFNPNELVQYLNQLDIVKAKFAALNEQQKASSLADVLKLNISKEISNLETLSNKHTGMDTFVAEINDAKISLSSLVSDLRQVNSKSDLDIVKAKISAWTAEFNKSSVAANKLGDAINSAIAPMKQRLTLANSIDQFLQNNTMAAKEFNFANIDWVQTLRSSGDVSKNELERIRTEFARLKLDVRDAGLMGKSFFDTLSDGSKKFGDWLIASGAIMQVVQAFKKSIDELQEINSILTEISKTSERTASELKILGDTSFDVASKYGRKASDYLYGVQEMSRAGYGNSEEMSELSTLAQAAGDMTSELANKYLIATDYAYKLNGEVTALNSALDGQNIITNRHALSMSDLAEATRVTASQAASSRVEIDEMTSAIGTMIAVTQQGGNVAGRAFKAILMNLQQVAGTVDEESGEIIGAEDLSKYENACKSLGVSLKEVKNGIVELRDPMQILKELAAAYTSLDEADSRRANLINAVGGKYRGNQLNALLENWSLYEEMLSDYSEGTGSAMEEAMKSASNWE